MSERDSSWVSGKDVGIVNFSRDPAIHERHVFICRYFDRLLTIVQPSERVIRASRHLWTGLNVADIHTTVLLVVNYLNKIPEVAFVLNNLVS